MKKMCAALSLCAALQAGSLMIINDSPYPLQATIFAGDGTRLGTMTLAARHSMTWTDYSVFNPGGQGLEQNTYSQTPYSVMWTCVTGQGFSVCENLSPGSMVTARGGAGPCSCPQPKKKQQQRGEGGGVPESSEWDQLGPP